jgi:hypothetical protein
LGHAATSPSTAIQNDSLLFTVNPDRSVGIGWNTTTFSPILQNASMVFPPGYAIQSSSSFSQQSNAVVETTNVQYQLPTQVYTQIPYSLINLVNLTATQTGMSGSGSLTLDTGLPVQSLNVVYTTSSNKIEANATAQIFFNSNFGGTPFANQTIFQSTWLKTFQNKTWTDNIAIQIQNATQVPNASNHFLTVLAFNGTVSYPNTGSATVTIGFVAVPTGSAADFVTAIENALSTSIPSGLDTIIRAALNLVTGESVKLGYSGTTGKLVIQYTTNYVKNLDSQLNSVKNQFFQFIMSLQPSSTITPSELFLNATTVTVSKISMTSDLDLNAGTSSTTLSGLLIGPPTVGTNTNFTITGLFQTLGSAQSSTPGINITLAGGSDSSNQVKVIVPSGTPAPSSTTSNSATWTNVKNATVLSAARFEVSPLPFSFFAFLTSPTGWAIEAIVVAAIIAGILLYARKRRAPKLPTPLSSAGPTPAPSFGPSPAPPSP